MDHSRHSCIVIDNGLFSGIAQHLAKNFGKVYYHTPWIEAFPRDSAMQLGAGLPGIERVDYWEDYVDKADLWIFPDCYFGPLQRLLIKLGHRVWGSGRAEELELLRGDAKEKLESLGIPIGDYWEVTGTNNLRDLLKKHDNVYVKFAFTRGDLETFDSPNYRLVEPVLDDLDTRLGPRKAHRRFYVEKEIKEAVEIAYDGYTVDGQFPKKAMWGIESKSKAYAGRIVPYDSFPCQITKNNAAIASVLEKYQARTWFGMETMVTKDGTGWVTDPLARQGNPPGALCPMMYPNIADIMWEGSEGKLIDPEGSPEWGAQLILYSGWSERHFQPVYYPKEIEENVVLVNHTLIDGTHYVVPGPDLNSAVGSVVATGKTLKEAVEKTQEYAKQVEGHDISYTEYALEKLMDEISHLKDYGLHL